MIRKLLRAAAAILLPAFVIGSSATSQTAPRTFEDVLEGVRQKHNVPSLAAVLIRDGVVVAAAAVGERARGSGVSVQLGDTYHLGSVSKSFTATMIAKLVEQNVLRWDATLEQLLPNQTMSASYRAVTLEQLLFHAGGFPANVFDLTLQNWNLEPSKARALYLEKALSSTPLSAPGQQSSYSNMGYVVAAIIAERVTGKSWEQLIRELVLEPLQMRGCGFGTRFQALAQPHGHSTNLRNQLYAVSPEGPNGNPPVVYGADGVRCGVEDMARYLLAHLRGARGEEGLLSKLSFAFLHQPRLEYSGLQAALGWFIVSPGSFFPNGLIWHNGSNTLNYAEAAFSPKQNLGFFIATNAPPQIGATAVNEATQAIFEWKP
jgi:CubicO group peptidase (beta-lactamase class C family)